MENDRVLNTSVWLKFDMADRDHVSSLRCEVCSQFKDKLVSMRPAFINGTMNFRTTTFKEHAATDMHAHAMVLFKKQRLYYNRQRTCLGEDTLDQLLRINVEAPHLRTGMLLMP